MANPLIFVDFPCANLDGTTRFYERLFGWTVNRRVPGVFHQIVTGDEDKLNMGMFAEERVISGPIPRLYLGVDDPSEYLQRAVGMGASKEWDERPCPEFDGSFSSFRDPSGIQIVMWRYSDGH